MYPPFSLSTPRFDQVIVMFCFKIELSDNSILSCFLMRTHIFIMPFFTKIYGVIYMSM